MIEHGASHNGQHIARLGNVRLIVEQTVVCNFTVGDKIGWEGDYWCGTIVTSEPDESGWHLAWTQDAEPGKTFHWRGRATVRDTCWFPESPFVIEELP